MIETKSKKRDSMNYIVEELEELEEELEEERIKKLVLKKTLKILVYQSNNNEPTLLGLLSVEINRNSSLTVSNIETYLNIINVTLQSRFCKRACNTINNKIEVLTKFPDIISVNFTPEETTEHITLL